MHLKATFIITAILLILLSKDPIVFSALETESSGGSLPVSGNVPLPVPADTSAPSTSETPVAATPAVVVVAPSDPCLPGLYANWQEFSQDDTDKQRPEFKWLRIYIDRSNFELVLDGVRKDDSIEEIYRTHVALGDVNSPTPEGRFIINHVYCYPDVVFFGTETEPIPGLYNGFFAPLQICDEHGRCQRFRELGLHGFQASAIPPGRHISPATVGAVSAGCIRVPDPCKFKKALIKAAGLNGLKQNDRGAYHWFKKPVEVIIGDRHPDSDETNLVSILERGVTQVQEGLKSLLDVFR